MSVQGKTIKLFIRDDGIKSAELTENSLCLYSGKLENLKILERENKISGPSVYILLSNPLESNNQKIYIGQSTNINRRFQSHKYDKDDFSHFIIFNGQVLKQAYLNYIEDVIFQKAKQNLIDTAIDTKQTNSKSIFLDEADKNDAKKVCDSIIFMLKHLSTINLINPEKKSDSPIFYLTLQKPYNDKKAMLRKVDEGYVLLRGSFIQPDIRDSFKCNDLRDKLINEKKMILQDKCFVATEDIPFSSCSTPASIVRGNSSNGKVEWKLENGTTLGEFENK